MTISSESNQGGIDHAEFVSEATDILERAWGAEGRNEKFPGVDMSEDLFESGAVDSFLIVELLGSLEEKYGVTIDLLGVDPAKMSTIDGLWEVFNATTGSSR